MIHPIPAARRTPQARRLLESLRKRLIRQVLMYGLGTVLGVAAVWLLFAYVADWGLRVPKVVRVFHGVTFFALVGLDNQSEAVLTAFEETMAQWQEVRECHMARGPHDFVLKLVARNTAHENELTTKLTSATHVATVQTIQGIRSAKTRPGVPIAPLDRQPQG